MIAVSTLVKLVDRDEVGDDQAKLNADQIGELGGYCLVKLLLDKWINVLAVQYPALSLLANTASNDPNPILQAPSP